MITNYDKIYNSFFQLGNDIDASEFLNTSKKTEISILFSKENLSQFNFIESIDNLINITTRLFHIIHIECINNDKVSEELISQLKKKYQKITHNIEYSTEFNENSHVISFTKLDIQKEYIYVYSSGWNIDIRRNPTDIIYNEVEYNPISSLFSTALAFNELYKDVFNNSRKVTESIKCNLINFSQNFIKERFSESISINDVIFAGTGAVGSIALLTLSKFKNLCGSITVIDNDELTEHNLQRYIAFNHSDINERKTKLIENMYIESSIKIESFYGLLEEYYATLDDKTLNLITISTDSEESRVWAQGMLPKYIINAYTGSQGELGVSRHRIHSEEPCLACFYTKDEQDIEDHDIVASWLKINPQDAYILMNKNELITQDLVNRLHKKYNHDFAVLKNYIGSNFGTFKNENLCGEMRVKSKLAFQNDESVPVIQQSVISGCLLALETMKFFMFNDDKNYRDIYVNIFSKINLQNGLKNFPKKDKCICRDQDYVKIYNSKYNIK